MICSLFADIKGVIGELEKSDPSEVVGDIIGSFGYLKDDYKRSNKFRRAGILKKNKSDLQAIYIALCDRYAKNGLPDQVADDIENLINDIGCLKEQAVKDHLRWYHAIGAKIFY